MNKVAQKSSTAQYLLRAVVALLWALPTWVLVNLMTPFLAKAHPWKSKWFPLTQWAINMTALTKAFDIMLWWSVLSGTVFLYT